jgi:glucosamine--fructose-6-phosphate aminotransferase (isomerizing)
MADLDNPMKAQVFSIPDFLREQYVLLEPAVRRILSTPEIFSIQRIILTGCGDSYAAALAVKGAFERMVPVPVEVVKVLDLARFYDKDRIGFAPYNPLVIAVSNSGSVARINEAVQRLTGLGAFSLGITGNPSSPLAQHASRILPLKLPPFVSAPGTRSYIASLLSLLLIAIRLGEVRGRYTMDYAMAMREDILKQADNLERLLPDMDRKTRTLAEAWRPLEAWDFIGSGDDYGSAWYGHAKVFEATGQYAMRCNSEEWLHLNFFARKTTQIGTVVIASADNMAMSRTREAITYMQALERPLALISDADWDDFDTQGISFVKTPSKGYPESIPITQCTPISLLVGYVMTLLGETPGRGCTGLWSFAQNGGSVRDSEIIIL